MRGVAGTAVGVDGVSTTGAEVLEDSGIGASTSGADDSTGAGVTTGAGLSSTVAGESMTGAEL